MNIQRFPSGIEWTRVWGRDGYTWNPVAGCEHGCRWTMPDGTTADCYAKTIVEHFQNAYLYPQGFEHHYWFTGRLREPVSVKKPAGIFLDSMGDLMGHWVDISQIKTVLEVCRSVPRHVFFLLTKNAPRLLEFEFPQNVWVGVSSPPDVFAGKLLSTVQKERMLIRSLEILSAVRGGGQRWMSFEPLSWDVSTLVQNSPPDSLTWAVIGAASRGARYYAPDTKHLTALVEQLDERGIPVFYKGNLRSVKWAKDHWREGYPPEIKNEYRIKQPRLF